jgi:DNA-binding MarR family transcriptional regulator
MRELATTFGEALRKYQAAVEDFDRLVATVLGVNRTDARCLEILMFDFPDGATPADLGAALGLTSGSVTTMVDRLVRSHHVVRKAHPSDKRKVVVVPTDQARQAADAAYRPLVEQGAELLARYSPAEIAAMIDFFTRASVLQQAEEMALRARHLLQP